MCDVEFNLLDEPWILALRPDGIREELSIIEVFRQAHQFERLAGELPTQDLAILRLLLAILHTVFARFDLEGNGRKIRTPKDARDRWEQLWNQGKISADLIEIYLRRFEHRFWLFHPELPFYQVSEIGKATEYPASKLIGELSESNNKTRVFSHRSGISKSSLDYPEAARWLLYVNAFDDTSAKSTVRGLPSPGAGWLGRIGSVIAVGDNLFETLMLNLILLPAGQQDIWPEERPYWEYAPRTSERTKVSIPDNLAELYTIQSRRLKLIRDANLITGYYLLGGDFFESDNALIEPMTVWHKVGSGKDKETYRPRRHDVSRVLWRDFSTLVIQSEQVRRPGVVSWLEHLRARGVLSKTHFLFQTVAVKYGDKDMSVDHVFSDSIAFNARLLEKDYEVWTERIIQEIGTTEALVNEVGYLAANLAKAAGGSADGAREIEEARSLAYFSLDNPFRVWLETLDPKDNNIEESMRKWWEISRSITRKLGSDLVRRAGPQAFVGKMLKVKRGGKEVEQLFTAPKAYNQFLYKTSSTLALKGGKRSDRSDMASR
jgi:CRISPR system Cascade subunit CasA